MKFKNRHIIFTSITCFVVLLSCIQKSIDPDVTIFQQELGEENIAMIDLLVEEFENHLDTHYPDLKTSEAYAQLLKDVSDQDRNNDSLLLAFQSKKSNESFRASPLYNELYVKEPYHQKIEGLVELNQPPPDKNNPINEPDSVYRINTVGKYMRALYTIKEKDSLVKKYFRIRDVFGTLAHYRSAAGILYSNPDFDNYIHKRIVVLEYSY